MLSSFAIRQRVYSGREPPVMTTLREICTAFGPEYLEHYPQLPLAHRKVISAIQQCQSGHYGHSLYQCHDCGEQHRVYHSCGNRHCPQCQHHKTQQWLQHHLDKQLPGPHFLLTFTVPEPPPLYPCASTPRVPRHVSRLGNCPQTAGRRRTLCRDRPTRLHRCPAHLGPATPVSPAYPLHRPWRRPLQGPHNMVSLSCQLLCPRQSALAHLPCLLQRRDAPRWSPGAD